MRIVNDALYFSDKCCVVATPESTSIITLQAEEPFTPLRDLSYSAIARQLPLVATTFDVLYRIIAGNIVSSILAHTVYAGPIKVSYDIETMVRYIVERDLLSNIRSAENKDFYSPRYVLHSLTSPLEDSIPTKNVSICGRQYEVPVLLGTTHNVCAAYEVLLAGLLNEHTQLIIVNELLSKEVRLSGYYKQV